MPKIANRIVPSGGKGAFDIWEKGMALEAQGKDIIHLEIGEPDFGTPEPIMDEAMRAMRAGRTTYVETAGSPGLRRAAAEYLSSTRQIDASWQNVLIGPGVKGVTFASVLALLEPGEEMLIPNPGFPPYQNVVNYAGAISVPYPLNPHHHFLPDVQAMEALMTDRTKVLLLNSPGNPTGTIHNESVLMELAAFAIRHDLWVISDEIYAQLYFTDQFPPSIYALPGMKERTILMDGCSKGYAMTGWRVGFGLFPDQLVRPVDILFAQMHSCLPPFVMDAAELALSGPQDAVFAMRKRYKERAEFLFQALGELPGIVPLKPEGAFYMMVDVSAHCDGDDRAFADRLLEFGVCVLPGSGMGSMSQGFVRMALTQPMHRLIDVVERIKQMIHSE